MTGALTLTNGAQKFSASVVVDGKDAAPTLVFDGACPPRDEDFWVFEVTELAMIQKPVAERGATVISFPT